MIQIQNLAPRIKKFLLYGCAIIGVLAVLFFLWNSLASNFLSSSSQSYIDDVGYGGVSGFENPMGALSENSSPLSFLNDLAAPSQSKNTNTDNIQNNIADGQLTQRKIIRNGSLSILVNKAEEVAGGLQGIAERLGGFVASSRVYEVSAGVKSGSVTIRVPADKFNEAITDIKKLAVKVESESTNTSDVTEQYVDLEAQLKNLRAEEAQYLEIMKKAFTVDDTLKVSRQLSNVRGNIERIEGQLKYLSRQVDMSTISVSMTAESDIEVFGIRWRPLFIIKQSFRNLLTGLTGYVDSMISFLFKLPVLILWVVTIAIFIVIIWRILKWVKRRFFSVNLPQQ